MAFGIIKKYMNMSYEDRQWLNTNISVLFTLFVVIGKLIAAVFGGFFFLISGIQSICMLMARYFCIKGNADRHPDIEKYNILIGFFVSLGGVQYSVFMARLLISSVTTMYYTMQMGLWIALFSSVDLVAAIVNNIRTTSDNVFLKHTKKINLCLAWTALSLTEFVILSFTDVQNSRFVGAIFGICVGIVIMLTGFYIVFSKMISLCGNEENDYERMENFRYLESGTLNILLYSSRIYPPVIYFGEVKDGKCIGWLTKGPSPIMNYKKWIWGLLAVLSPILLIPYITGVFIVTLDHHKLLKKLDEEMLKRGFKRIDTVERTVK